MPAPLSAAAASAPSSGQGAYVVDDVRAGGNRGAHHLGLAGVDRNEHGGLAPQIFDDRDDALELHGEFSRLRAGPRRLATDVDDARALGDHAPRMRQRRRAIRVAATVGEGIRRDVEHAHDHGRCEIEDPIAAFPLDGGAHGERPPPEVN